MELNDKTKGIIRGVSHVTAGFTMVVAVLMILSFVQLKTINPVDNPVLQSIKDEYDKDPNNAGKAEQVRVLDLMARKAYFSSQWQIDTGSYLLLAGAIIFIVCQRLLAGTEKPLPKQPGAKADLATERVMGRKTLLSAGSVIFITAITGSLLFRSGFPDVSGAESDNSRNVNRRIPKDALKPDKTNYPFFRGHNGSGVGGGTGYPDSWNGENGTNIKWKTAIPKTGKSSPVIWGDKIFITGAEDPAYELYCIDKKNGNILWTALASGIEGQPAELPDMDHDAGLAVSSVATDGKSVCAIFANGNLVCTDFDGKIKWAKNLGAPENAYGYSSSLVIYEEILLVQYDDNNKVSLMGFNTSSGDMLYETIREGRPVWSSPVLAFFDGTPQVIINGNPFVSAYDPFTGTPLWKVECLTGDVGPSVAVNSTMVYAVTDYAKLAAIKPGIGSSIVWEDNTFTPDVSSPVANDEFLFLATGSGDVACYNAAKGDTMWTHYFEDQFYASPILCDDKVYLVDRSGVTHIVRAKGELEIIGHSPLGERSDCTPAFSDREIFIRGKDNLYCISGN